MRICLMIEGQEDVTWEQWLALAGACEEHGLEGLFRSDHYMSVMGRRGRGSLDAWATLAGLAARTSRIRLGTMVSPVTFRHPSVLAKMVVTVDHISGGRAELDVDFDGKLYRLEGLDAMPKPLQQPRPNLIVGGAVGPRSAALAARWADEYNTTFVSSLDDCRQRRRRLDAAWAEAGRDPDTACFSLMIGCVVG